MSTTDTYTNIPANLDCQWGIADTVAYGTATTMREARAGKFAEHKNQQGAVTGKVFYDAATTVTFEVVAKNGQALPDPGAVIKVGAVDYLVENAEKICAAEDFVKFSVTATRGKHFAPASGT